MGPWFDTRPQTGGSFIINGITWHSALYIIFSWVHKGWRFTILNGEVFPSYLLPVGLFLPSVPPMGGSQGSLGTWSGMVWSESLGCVEGCAGCCGLSSPTGWKRDAENLSSQEPQGKPCDKGSPVERGPTDYVRNECHLQTEAG